MRSSGASGSLEIGRGAANGAGNGRDRGCHVGEIPPPREVIKVIAISAGNGSAERGRRTRTAIAAAISNAAFASVRERCGVLTGQMAAAVSAIMVSGREMVRPPFCGLRSCTEGLPILATFAVLVENGGVPTKLASAA